MTIDPRPNSLVLSKGCVLDVNWKGSFAGATACQLRFYDINATVVATVDGDASATVLSFLYTDVAALDALPHGMPYELFVTVGGNPYKLFYGTVVRREVTAFGDIVKAI